MVTLKVLVVKRLVGGGGVLNHVKEKDENENRIAPQRRFSWCYDGVRLEALCSIVFAVG